MLQLFSKKVRIQESTREVLFMSSCGLLVLLSTYCGMLRREYINQDIV